METRSTIAGCDFGSKTNECRRPSLYAGYASAREVNHSSPHVDATTATKTVHTMNENLHFVQAHDDRKWTMLAAI